MADIVLNTLNIVLNCPLEIRPVLTGFLVGKRLFNEVCLTNFPKKVASANELEISTLRDRLSVEWIPYIAGLTMFWDALECSGYSRCKLNELVSELDYSLQHGVLNTLRLRFSLSISQSC